MNISFVDISIVGILVFFVLRGLFIHAYELIAESIGFMVAFVVTIYTGPKLGLFLEDTFSFQKMFAGCIAYIAVWIAVEFFVSHVAIFLLSRIMSSTSQKSTTRVLGVFSSLMQGMITLFFIVNLVSMLPLRVSLPAEIRSSILGATLLSMSETHVPYMVAFIRKQAQELTEFVTIYPQSTEFINLQITPQATDMSEDAASESELLNLLNSERVSRGLPSLTTDTRLTLIARSYSETMFLDRYFSHVDTKGRDIADRLREREITYREAAENLAYAPDVYTAHQGLLQSVGHRRNMLDPTYQSIGIGVIDAGRWGKMVTQIFIRF